MNILLSMPGVITLISSQRALPCFSCCDGLDLRYDVFGTFEGGIAKS